MNNKLKETHVRTTKLYHELFNYLGVLFTEIPKKQLSNLNQSSLSYFYYLLSLDAIIDSSVHSDSETQVSLISNFKSGITAQEKSIRQLTKIFNEESEFWFLLEETRGLFFNALQFEKKVNKERPQLSRKAFENIAVSKSIMCHLVIYALQDFTKNKKYEEQLKNCLNHIHIALQYIDDIDDFKLDFLNGQWTYPQSLLKTFLLKQKIDIRSIDEMQKYLYVSNVAQKCIKNGIKHYNKAYLIAAKLKMTDFAIYIELQKEKCENYIKEINWLIYKSKVKSLKSNKKRLCSYINNILFKFPKQSIG